MASRDMGELKRSLANKVGSPLKAKNSKAKNKTQEGSGEDTPIEGVEHARNKRIDRQTVEDVLHAQGVDLIAELVTLARASKDERVRASIYGRLLDKTHSNKKEVALTLQTSYEEMAGLIKGASEAEKEIRERDANWSNN